MAMSGLTPEQRQLVEQAGDEPVPIEDPEIHEEFILMRRRVYEQMRGATIPTPAQALTVPEGIRRSQEAFFRDLPALLRKRRLRGKFVAYHGTEPVKIARTETDVIRECLRRGLRPEEYDVFVIRPQSPEPEEVEYPSSWYDL